MDTADLRTSNKKRKRVASIKDEVQPAIDLPVKRVQPVIDLPVKRVQLVKGAAVVANSMSLGKTESDMIVRCHEMIANDIAITDEFARTASEQVPREVLATLINAATDGESVIDAGVRLNVRMIATPCVPLCVRAPTVPVFELSVSCAEGVSVEVGASILVCGGKREIVLEPFTLDYEHNTRRVLVRDLTSTLSSAGIVRFWIESCTSGKCKKKRSSPHAIGISSNARQWPTLARELLLYYMFDRHPISTVPLVFAFNVFRLVQMASGRPGDRTLTLAEFKHWITKVTISKRGSLALAEGTVAYHTFADWLSNAMPVLYVLKSSTYVNIKSLWASSYVSLGISHPLTSACDDEHVYAKLCINLASGSDDGDAAKVPPFLLCFDDYTSVELMTCELGNLGYFFQYSSRARGCTRLVGATDDMKPLSTSHAY